MLRWLLSVVSWVLTVIFYAATEHPALAATAFLTSLSVLCPPWPTVVEQPARPEPSASVEVTDITAADPIRNQGKDGIVEHSQIAEQGQNT